MRYAVEHARQAQHEELYRLWVTDALGSYFQVPTVARYRYAVEGEARRSIDVDEIADRIADKAKV